MKKILFLLLLLPAIPTALSAQEEPAAVRKREPFVRQHELRLTAGAYPIIPSSHQWFWLGDWGCSDFACGHTHRGPIYTSGAWSLSYDYRFKKWFDLGLTLGYYGEYSKTYSNKDLSLTSHNRAHFVTVMPLLWFTWLNRKWVRMYTTIGLGATFGTGTDFDGEKFSEDTAAFQFTPIGISVGRSLFGFAEVGLGAQGVLMMGVGYKFKPKNKPTK